MSGTGTLAMQMRARRVPVVCGLLLIVVGCRPEPTTVGGAVTLDGKPLTMATDTRGSVVFQPTGGHGIVATAVLDTSGQYSLGTGSSTEITPGKYQVAITVTQLLPKADQVEQGAKRITPAKYASANESGLQVEVIPGANRLNFDLTSSTENDASPAAAPLPTSSSSVPLPEAAKKHKDK